MKWYRHFPGDFYHGTVGMTLEEIGAYILVLGELYGRKGVLADDPHRLAVIWRCNAQKAKRLRNALVQRGKLQVEAGILVNARATAELEATKVWRKLQQVRAEKRWKIKAPPMPILHTTDINKREFDKEVANLAQYRERATNGK